MEKKHLGKGLSDLMNEKSNGLSFVSRKSGGAITYLPVQNLSPNPFQPRKVFDDDSMKDLVRSVEVKGILQPILVRPKKNTTNLFEIIAGERRWRAAQHANFMEIPAIIKNFSDREILEVAIIENLQREDMNSMDEARGFQSLSDKFGYTYKEIASKIGKSQSYVSNVIRLLNLSPEIQKKVQKGEMSASHARALLSSKGTEEEKEVLVETATTGTVKDLKEKIQNQKKFREKPQPDIKFNSNSDLQNDLLDIKLMEYEKDIKGVIGEPFKSFNKEENDKITVVMEFDNFESVSKWIEKFKK